jgi:hypothetical protein
VKDLEEYVINKRSNEFSIYVTTNHRRYKENSHPHSLNRIASEPSALKGVGRRMQELYTARRSTTIQ